MGELGIARKRQLSVMEMGDECGVIHGRKWAL